MPMSVQTNMGSISALKNMNINSSNMNKSLERLSSGFRINSASDDAAGYAISAKLQGEKGKLEAASQNSLQATAMVKTAESGVNEIENMVRRLQVLATQAASANNGANERTKLAGEAANLLGQIDKIANGVNYNGTKLLDGSGASTTTFQVGAANSANDQVAVDFSADFTTATTGLGIAAIDLTTASGAATAIDTLNTALDGLTTDRASFGAAVNQLSYVSANLATQMEQVSASISTIKDADMAKEMADFTKSQVLVQAGTSMLAQANQSSQNVLSLFR
ncbi:flagellin [Mariprofundus ferrinatatus]|uniref:Flagellin n=1 Tax=Mariprofundus ferrinatatus TaxID=1921087 RepID=A0A2K8LAN5_9PROT|nr:flagellin [Mariprofundus ferrinatatus]ATX82961.1 flagellin [Mariprofundus ferrinatatus]